MMRDLGPRRWVPGRDRRAERHAGPRGLVRTAGRHVVVVGGGIAGLSAATHLVERGVDVTLCEREPYLGGRASSWQVTLPSGERTPMSRGFHAFFRQYYQLRALLRRADPTLACLRPVDDYPLVLRDGARDSFARIPRTPPFNLAGFVAASPSFPVRALGDVDLDAALGLLDVSFPGTFEEYDGVSAADVLDRLRFPPGARHLALEVFARSFFADPSEFSGGELVAMFHTYFVGSAEGLLFDVARDDFTTSLWDPLAAHLRRSGVRIETGCRVEAVSEDSRGVRVHTDSDELAADGVVLATDVAPLRALVERSPSLGDAAWRERIAALRTSPPFAVWRRWYETRPAAGSPDFLGTSGYGPLDNVSLVHQMEDSARAWADAHRGAVVELHAYALGDGVDEAALRAELAVQQDLLHPELATAPVVGEQWLLRRDCPLVDPSPWRERPGVRTPSARVVLAGDGIRCAYPVALMERAATTGLVAANTLLESWGVAGADVWTAPTSARLPGVGLLRRLMRTRPSSSRN